MRATCTAQSILWYLQGVSYPTQIHFTQATVKKATDGKNAMKFRQVLFED